MRNLLKINSKHIMQQIAGFEPDDIESDDFDLAVNDDQFCTCRIVECAESASNRIDELEKLLNLFIVDLYKSSSGRVSRKTAISAMKFVSENKELQDLVNSSDWNSIRKL